MESGFGWSLALGGVWVLVECGFIGTIFKISIIFIWFGWSLALVGARLQVESGFRWSPA